MVIFFGRTQLLVKEDEEDDDEEENNCVWGVRGNMFTCAVTYVPLHIM